MRAELPLGEPSGKMAIGADEHRTPWQRTRQHLRLVARILHRLEHAIPITHDNHAIDSRGVARNRGSGSPDAAPMLEQHPRQRGNDRRLAAAADGRLPTLMTGRSRLRLDCGCRSYHERRIARHVSVGRAQNTQWITRKGRTTAGG